MAIYYIAYDGTDSSTNAESPNTPWRTITKFVENARTKGDVAILRRIRGGFNPGDNVWINNYCSRDSGGTNARNARFLTSGVLQGAWDTNNTTASLQKHTGLVGQSMHRHTLQNMVPSNSATAGVVDSNAWGGVINLPRQGYIDHMSPHVADENVTTPIDSWEEMWMGRTTNPRDKSRVYYMSKSEYNYFNRTVGDPDASTGDANLRPNSSGTHDDPIIVMADYENVYGDFLCTKKSQNGSDGFQKWSGAVWDENTDAQYKVTVGSKIISRRDQDGVPVEVHSYITPGDWICVGEFNDSTVTPYTFNPNLSDDPYEHSYMVRDVNYDKIVLWLPYKGQRAGSQQNLVSMGYAPRLSSLMRNGQASSMNTLHTNIGRQTRLLYFHTSIKHWTWQGIEFFHCFDNASISATNNTNAGPAWQAGFQANLIYAGSDNTTIWVDCTFWGASTKNDNWESYEYYGHNTRGHRISSFYFSTSGNLNQHWKKCLFSGGKYGIYDNTTQGRAKFKVEDCIFNGSIVDRICVGYMGEFGKDSTSNHFYYQWFANQLSSEGAIGIKTKNTHSDWDIVDTEFVNWYGTHISHNENTDIQMRGCKFLGMGMDFVDPFTTSNAEAQENLGLRHSRALFTPNDNALADGSGLTSIKHIDRTTGKFVSNSLSTGENLGRQFFVENSANNAGTNAVAGGISSVIAGSWYQKAKTYHDEGDSSQNGRIYGSNDNTLYIDTSLVGGNGDACDYDAYPMYNGALSLYGAKGLANGTSGNFYNFVSEGNIATDGLVAKIFGVSGSALIFDWDETHRSGDGGTWCLTASYPGGDTHQRFPHVYGGVPLPPSMPELSKPAFMFVSQWATHWEVNSTTFPYPYNNESNDEWLPNNNLHENVNWYKQPNNTTLALMEPSGDDNNYNRADWNTSQGCGRGIGSAPNLGSVYGYDGNWDANILDFDDQFARKITSQDHYELCLNHDYNFYYGKGAGSLFLDDGEKQLYKPLLTGKDGLARGILYKQSSQFADSIGGRSADSQWKWWYYRPWIYETITNTDIQQSGGGNYLIRCHPSSGYVSSPTMPNPMNHAGNRTTDLTSVISPGYARSYRIKGALKIFEYPFYLSTNARTYSVSFRRATAIGDEDWLSAESGVGEKFNYALNPSSSEIWLEFEFWDMDSTITSDYKMVRKKSHSLTGVDFSDASWQELSITIEPKTEGVGYLRLFYSKENETNKYNVFYVDPKVVVY